MTAGSRVDANTSVAELQNFDLSEQLELVEQQLSDAKLRWKILSEIDPAEAARQHSMVTELSQQRQEVLEQLSGLRIANAEAGLLVGLPAAGTQGRYLAEGTPIAVVVDGEPRLRVWLNEDQLGGVTPSAGTEVEVRVPGRSTQAWRGTVTRVKPAAETVFSTTAVTYMAGGEILIDPASGRPIQPLFQIDINRDADAFRLSEYGARVSVRFPGNGETLAQWTMRKCYRFVQQLLVA